MKIKTLLCVASMLAFASCSKNSDSAKSPSTRTTFTFYGSSQTDVVTLDTMAKNMRYQGQTLTYSKIDPDTSGKTAPIHVQRNFGYVASAELSFPKDGASPTLKIADNIAGVFVGSIYTAH